MSGCKIAMLILLSLTVGGCSRDQAKDIAKKFDPRFPRKPAMHVVQLTRVQVGASDFGTSTFGNPLGIRVSLRENGKEIPAQGQNVLAGTRGERVLERPIQWIVNFDPRRNYQIYIEEQSIIAQAHWWSIPGTPQIGYWPIAENGGKIDFGKESYFRFTDNVAK